MSMSHNDVLAGIGKIVAERRLQRRAGGEVLAVIGEPRQSGANWECQCAVLGLEEVITGVSHGVDSMQALQLAFAWLREALAPHRAALLWLAEGVPLGFPRQLPEDIPGLEDQVETLIQREEQRIADSYRKK
jgi:hypothetical protein